jgi:hypothetical protein
MTALSLLNPESTSANSTTSYCLNLQSFFFLHVGTRRGHRAGAGGLPNTYLKNGKVSCFRYRVLSSTKFLESAIDSKIEYFPLQLSTDFRNCMGLCVCVRRHRGLG